MDVFRERPPLTKPAKVDETTFLRVIWAGAIVSLAFLGIRLYARWKSFKKLFLDDGFVIFAWLLALLTAIDWQVVADFLFHFIDITRGRLWPPPATFVNDTERYYKGSVVVIVMFYTGLWAVKFSFLLFFKRLGQNVAGQKVLWWCVLGFTVVTYLLCIGDIQYSCLAAPFAKIEIRCSTDSAVQYQRVTLALNCAVDVVTDYLIMAIPISMLWGVQMSVRKKAALIGIFSLTVITTLFAIVRVTVISSLTRQPDPSWAYMWSAIEQCIAIVVACLASFPTLFTQQGSRLREPKYSLQDASRNLFLRGTRRTRPPQPDIRLTGLSACTQQSTQPSALHDDGNLGPGFNYTHAGSTEHIVSPNAIRIKEDV